jgi:hypothetical protein
MIEQRRTLMKSTAIFWRSALMLALTGLASAGPLRLTPGLTGINVYESTGTTTQYTFIANAAGIAFPNIFSTAANESYQIYFSNALGADENDGEYLSIDCFFAGPGGGCNINGIELVTSGSSIFANVLASFRSGNDGGYVVGSELNAVDSSLTTFSTLGRDGESNMRLTVAFNGSPGNEVPEPSTYALMGLALTAGAFLRKRRR